MPKIIIGNDVINFPDSGSDALWSPAVIQFAEAVELQLLASSNTYDISPSRVQISSNPATLTVNLGISFDGSFVRKFVLDYVIYRIYDYPASPTSCIEAGTLTGSFDTAAAQGWILQDEFNGSKKVDGTSYHQFFVDYSNANLIKVNIDQFGSGTIYTPLSAISFSAKTELVNVI